MEAIDLLLSRRSAAVLIEPGPDEAALELLLAAGAHAPDHGRLRPWRFIVIQGRARERLGELFAERLQRSRPDASPDALARERAKALRAPLIIAVAAVTDPHSAVPEIEQILCAGAAATNMLLAARALGFNAVWKTGAAAYDETVKRELGIMPADALVAFLYIGTESPGRDGPTPPRAWRDRASYWPDPPVSGR
jgi:nitroreductase